MCEQTLLHRTSKIARALADVQPFNMNGCEASAAAAAPSMQAARSTAAEAECSGCEPLAVTSAEPSETVRSTLLISPEQSSSASKREFADEVCSMAPVQSLGEAASERPSAGSCATEERTTGTSTALSVPAHDVVGTVFAEAKTSSAERCALCAEVCSALPIVTRKPASV